ncbi:MAG TPA: CsgG/HfaB family protein [Candidatus Krumholzibacteria bacterium]|nr:CsgG/HfaB family protein [Candidatus Krumholzibacteria bacterium]
MPSITPFRLALAGLLVGAAGCAGPVHQFTHTEADMSFYQKVGVIPFRSMTADAFAGEKFTSAFTTALLSSRKFEVLDPGIFAATLKQVTGARIPEDSLTPEQLKKLGEAAGVQGIFIGSVSQYEMMPTGAGPFPVITVDVRFIDVGTGTVVWTASASERGGPKTPIIGVGEVHTLGELADRLSSEMVGSLK